MSSQIFIVDDHAIMRSMLSEMISRMDGLSVCCTAATAEEALQHLNGIDVDLVLVDMAMPGMSGAEFVATLNVQRPGLHCLILSGHRDAQYVESAMEAGARGYVLKGDPKGIERAVRQVLAGETYVSPPPWPRRPQQRTSSPTGN